jgi:aldose 1-epimerase
MHKRNFKFSLHILAVLVSAIFVSSCGDGSQKPESGNSDSAANDIRSGFQSTIDNMKTDLYILKNANRMQAAITNYGGRLVGLVVPDRSGKLTDVVEGFDSVSQYVNSTEPYFGATIGRYGNRIAKGKFSLDGKAYTLFTNNGPNTLHGGKKGFQAVVWNAQQPNDSTLVLTYRSPDGEEGFPGNLDVKVTYSLSGANELVIDYEAVADKRTPVNLTNHAFFNLNGAGSGTINNHVLMINADTYTPVDSTLIPTGKIESVQNTPFDFRSPVAIGARVDSPNVQLTYGKGYDHNFVINSSRSDTLITAATVSGDKSGIFMEVLTDQPGLQFYGGNFMQSKNTMKNGNRDDFRTAFCLETQHFPDSPNQPQFPSTILEPGKTMKSRSVYRFSTR